VEQSDHGTKLRDTLCRGYSGLFNHKFDYRAGQHRNIQPLVSDSLIGVFNHGARLFLLDTGSKEVKPFIVPVMMHAFEWLRLCVISLCFHGNLTIRVLSASTVACEFSN